MHISIANISKMMTARVNITIAIRYELACGISIIIFGFDPRQFYRSVVSDLELWRLGVLLPRSQIAARDISCIIGYLSRSDVKIYTFYSKLTIGNTIDAFYQDGVTAPFVRLRVIYSFLRYLYFVIISEEEKNTIYNRYQMSYQAAWQLIIICS